MGLTRGPAGWERLEGYLGVEGRWGVETTPRLPRREWKKTGRKAFQAHSAHSSILHPLLSPVYGVEARANYVSVPV